MSNAAAVETVMTASVRLPPRTPSAGNAVVVAFVTCAAVVVAAAGCVGPAVGVPVVVTALPLLNAAVASGEFSARVMVTVVRVGAL